MRVITISDDKTVLTELKELEKIGAFQLEYYTGDKNNLEVFSFLCLRPQELVIIDNDFLKKDTVKLVKFLRQLNGHLNIIFITSDNSIALGKEVCPLGVLLYLIKPFRCGTLKEVLISQQNRNTV